MADIAVVHTFTTPAGTIVFNDGSADQFYLGPISGLDGTPARRVTDKTAYGDGGIIHPGFLDLRVFQPTGSLLIRSTRNMDAIVVIRNQMEADLAEAYESTLNATGTWQWQPQGQSSRTLTVQRDSQPCEFVHADNFQVVDFSFGLIAANPVWV